MADSSFETEVQALQKFLAMQKTTPSPEKVVVTPNQLDIQPEDFVSPRYFKKIKSKQVSDCYVHFACNRAVDKREYLVIIRDNFC